MATIEERLDDLEAKYAAHGVFINKFMKIKKMVIRKSEGGRIQLRDVE